MTDRDELLQLIKDIAVVHGPVTLSSGAQADYYIDLRRITLHRAGAPLVGRVLRELTADWEYDAVGGLTLGADPIATAMLHASGGQVDAFVVRKEGKKHGMQRRVEGPDVTGRRVLVVEDVSTTGSSARAAVEALADIDAHIVGVAVILDRGGWANVESAGFAYRSAYTISDLGLS